MKITHIIIHELTKEAGVTGASLKLYDELMNTEDKRIIKLIAELNNRYKYRSENYGVFDKADPTIFHEGFGQYYNKQSDEEFISFSQGAANDLKKRIHDNAPAKGGYLIFVRYKQVKDFTAVFVVRNIIGVSFSPGIKKMKVDDVEHIDFEHLAMACRVNMEAFKKKEIRYLSFIGRNQDEMSRYFTRWISSADTESNEEETKKLYTILTHIAAKCLLKC